MCFLNKCVFNKYVFNSRERAKVGMVENELNINLDAWKQAYEYDLKQLNLVIDHRPPSDYLCTFYDNHWEWLTLPRNLEQVEDYWEYLKAHPKSNNIDDDIYGEWVPNSYVLDVDDTENEQKE